MLNNSIANNLCFQLGGIMTITKKNVLDTLSKVFPTLKQKYDISKIGVFGSVARNQDNSESDIDIIVEMHPDLFKRICLKNELESILGKKVDVVRYWKGMNRFLKQRINREGLYV
jgi:predicted nucleotidyltransferase